MAATRSHVVTELRGEFASMLEMQASDGTTIEEMNEKMGQPLFGVLPMRFHVMSAKIIISGAGFELLRMRFAAAQAKRQAIKYMMPFITPYGPHIIPSKIIESNTTIVGYEYKATKKGERAHLWAFFKAVKQINARFKSFIASPPVGNMTYGIIGVDVAYDEPEWVTTIAAGNVLKNPIVTQQGAWYFGEQGTDDNDFEKVIKKLHKLQGPGAQGFKNINTRFGNFDEPVESEEKKPTKRVRKTAPEQTLSEEAFAIEEARRLEIWKRHWQKYWPTRSTARRVAPTIGFIGFNSHARTLVYDGDKTVFVIDPWMHPSEYAHEASFINMAKIFKRIRGWDVVGRALPRPDQEDEGSCGVASLARGLWIAHKGQEVMLQSPIPADYAVLAKRLVMKGKASDNMDVKSRKLFEPINEEDTPSLPSTLRRNTPSPTTSPVNPDACLTLLEGVTLKPHQRRVVDYMVKNKPHGLCLFHTVGSGKTITAIAVAACMLSTGAVRKVYIAAPTSVVSQFDFEVKRMVPANLLPAFEVMTHDKIVKTGADIVDGETLLIVDEAHNFKNVGKIRTDSLFFTAKRAAHILLLSATPIIDKPEDLAPLIAMMRSSNNLELRAMQNSLVEGVIDSQYIKCMFSVYKTRASDDYPSYTEKYITIPMDPSYYAKYVEIQNNKIGEDIPSSSAAGPSTSSAALNAAADAIFKNPKKLNVFLSSSRMASNSIGDVMSAKLVWAMERIQRDITDGRKVMIYSQFLDSGIEIIQRELTARGMSFGVVDGAASIKQRKAVVADYNRGMLNVIIITMAGAEGIDLKGTRTVLVLEPWFNAGKTQQIVGRAVRYRSHTHLPKAEQHVDVFYLVLKKPTTRLSNDVVPLSVDEYLYRISEAKDARVAHIYKRLTAESVEKCAASPGTVSRSLERLSISTPSS